MKYKFVIAAVALCAVSPSALFAQVVPPAAPLTAPAAAPVTLSYKFVVGQVHRYQYDMDMNMLMLTGQTGAGIPINTTMQMTMKQYVKSVRPTDGAATLITRIEEMHMLNNGQEAPLPDDQQAKMKQPFTQVMLPTGKILSMDMPAIGGAGMPGMDFSKGMFSGMAFLPTGSVKIGDTWDGTTAAAMAGVSLTFKSTLTGIDQKNGASLAAIQNKQTGTLDMTMTKGMPAPVKIQGQITGTGSQVFDTTAGAIQSAAGTSSTDMTMTFGPSADGAVPTGMPQGMKMQMQMKYKMERLSDTAPAVAP
ncbi:MAG: hypothetical protein ACRYFS_00145 [Janthinobacterium lividum]